MRAVVQRVSSARVEVGDQVTGAIQRGLLVLLGVAHGDTAREAEWMAQKIANLRIFEDGAGKMNLSLLEGSRAVIVVSQFTLYGDARKGRRPSFLDACEPEEANRLYERTCQRLRDLGLQVGTGIFRAQMKVALVNDGPVTILLETPPRARPPGS